MKQDTIKALVLIAGYLIVLFVGNFITDENLERSMMDIRYWAAYYLHATPDLSTQIRLVSLDDELVSKMPVVVPFPRDVLASIIKFLSEARARVIALDIILDKPSNPYADSILADAIQQAGNVIIPGYLSYSGENSVPELIEPLPMFMSPTYMPSFVNMASSNIQRKFALFRNTKDGLIYSFPVVASAIYAGKEPEEIVSEFAERKEKDAYINYTRPAKEIHGYSGALIFADNPSSPEFFKDKIVFVGAEYRDASDVYFFTPFSRPLFQDLYSHTPGVKLHINSVNTILQKRPLTEVPEWIEWFFSLMIMLAASFGFRKIGTTKGIFLFLASVVFVFIFSIFLFAYFDKIFQIHGILLALLAGAVSAVIFRFMDLRGEAIRDKNTELFNIRYFNKIMGEMFMQARKKRKPFCAVMFDLDKFKSFNDEYGHDIGDLVLAKTAHVLKTTVGKKGMAARYGGEEMTIALPNMTVGESFAVAEKIRTSIMELKLSVHGKQIRQITISGGLAGGLELPESLSALIKQADKALYEAKNSGRNRIVVFEQKNEEVKDV